MRLAILSGLLLAAVGGSGTYMITSVSNGHDVPFSTRYMVLVDSEPETVYRHLDEAVGYCAPGLAGVKPPVRRMAIEAFATMVQMKSEGQTEEAFDAEMARMMNARSGDFTSGDFAALKRAVATVLEDDREICILAEAKRGLVLHMATKTREWKLRL